MNTPNITDFFPAVPLLDKKYIMKGLGLDNIDKTIAISGCAGFVGNVLIRHFLDLGYNVIGMDNCFKGNYDSLLSVINHPKFTFFNGDVTIKDDCKRLVEKADYVAHLGSLVGFPICKKHPTLAKLVNVDGTANMVRAADGRPFVFTSTGSVYGAVKDICTEESPLNTNTIYGITKKDAELIVKAERNTVIFRYSTAFGASANMRVNLLVNDFVNRALTENCLVVFEADFRRTFIHLQDFVRSIEFAFLRYPDMQEQKVFNCGDEKLNWTKRQLAEYVSQKTGCHVFYGETGKDLDVRDYACSFKKLNDLGFYCKVSMEQGIDELLKTIPLLQMRNPYS